VSCEHHSHKLQTGFFQLIEKTLDEKKIQPEQIENVIIGIGPGSFTGVRIGVCFAKTFCQLTGAKLVPVRSYYLGIDDFQPETYYLALTPSTRFECYAALYRLDSNRKFENIQDVSDGKPDRICGWMKDIPDGVNLVIYGEGVELLKDLTLPDGIKISILEKNYSLPNADRALRFPDEFPGMCIAADPLVLKPLYVRPSPAEMQSINKEKAK
jgi:tRNA threonylcarbamoyladenosine biosynthesis protein TsaB